MTGERWGWRQGAAMIVLGLGLSTAVHGTHRAGGLPTPLCQRPPVLRDCRADLRSRDCGVGLPSRIISWGQGVAIATRPSQVDSTSLTRPLSDGLLGAAAINVFVGAEEPADGAGPAIEAQDPGRDTSEDLAAASAGIVVAPARDERCGAGVDPRAIPAAPVHCATTYGRAPPADGSNPLRSPRPSSRRPRHRSHPIDRYVSARVHLSVRVNHSPPSARAAHPPSGLSDAASATRLLTETHPRSWGARGGCTSGGRVKSSAHDCAPTGASLGRQCVEERLASLASRPLN